MSSNIKNFISNLHKYDEKFLEPVSNLIEYRNLSQKITGLEAASKDLKSHQWKKIGLYTAAGALVVATLIASIAFFKLTLPYILANFGRGIGDALGILGAGHVVFGVLFPIAGFTYIYDLLTVDSQIEKLKKNKEKLEGQIQNNIESVRELQNHLITRKNKSENLGKNTISLDQQIKAIELLLKQ